MTEGLTNDDIKALRQATTVGFIRRADGDFLVASKEVRADNDVFSSTEGTMTVHREIPASGRIVRFRGQPSEPVDASEYLNHYDAELRTFVGLLRAGDKVEIEWIVSNDSDPMREAGWTADELRVVVTRGKTALTFLLRYRVVPTSNTFRMVYTRRREWSV